MHDDLHISSDTRARPRPPRRWPATTILLAILSAALALSPRLSAALQFEPTRAGQSWRWFSCHLTHWSAEHLAWSLGVFLLLAAICELRDRLRFVLCVLLASLLIPPAVMRWEPQLDSYRGLSGIDSAVFVMLAVLLLREWVRERRGAWEVRAALAALLLLAFVGKILFEMRTGHAVFVDSAASGFSPSPAAHLAGAIAGAVSAFVPRRVARTANQRPPATIIAA